MAIKDKLTAAKGARQQTPSDDGEDLSVRIANLERDLADARAKLGENEKEVAKWRAEAEQSAAKYTSEKLRSALRAAAQKAEAVDADDVVELLLPKGARIDGDRVVFGQGADAKDADAFVAQFVESKPHLRKSAAVAQGSGAPTATATKAPAEPPPQTIDRNDPAFAEKWRKQQIENVTKRQAKNNGA